MIRNYKFVRKSGHKKSQPRRKVLNPSEICRKIMIPLQSCKSHYPVPDKYWSLSQRTGTTKPLTTKHLRSWRMFWMKQLRLWDRTRKGFPLQSPKVCIVTRDYRKILSYLQNSFTTGFQVPKLRPELWFWTHDLWFCSNMLSHSDHGCQSLTASIFTQPQLDRKSFTRNQ